MLCITVFIHISVKDGKLILIFLLSRFRLINFKEKVRKIHLFNTVNLKYRYFNTDFDEREG